MMNSHGHQLLGYSDGELVGRNWFEAGLPQPDGMERVYPIFQRLMQGEIKDVEYVEDAILRADGAIRQVAWHNTILRDDNGAVIGVLTAGNDITEQQLARERLERSQESLKLAQSIARLGSWELDLIENRLQWSDEVFRIFEIDPDAFEPSYERFVATIHPEDRGLVTEAYARSIRERRPYSIEHRLLMPNGRIKYVHERGDTQYDATGRALRSFGTVLDITERKLAEQALRDSETRLRGIFENVPIGIFQSTPEGKFSYVNPALARMLGYASPRELIEVTNQTSIAEALYETPTQRPALVKAITDPSGEAQVFENRYRCKDGRIIDAILSFGERTDPLSGQRFLFGFVYDVTAQKQIQSALINAKQDAEAASRAKSEFLANISHEIRTPMNSVMGLAQLLLDTELSTRQRDYLGKLNRAAKALLGVLNDILDYAKLEAGKVELEAVDIELTALLEVVADLFALAANSKGVELIFAVDPAVPEVLLGDPPRLRQVINNLLGNAVKFTQEGHILLDIRVQSHNGDGPLLQLSVQDTGIGMTAKQRERLFLPFEQADTSTTRHFGGTGLGLAICQGLVEQMGGCIRVVSKPGLGSTFTVTLPLTVSPAAMRLPKRTLKWSRTEDAARIQARGEDHPDANPPRTLIVAAGQIAREALKSLLTAWSCAVDLADSGDEAVRKVLAAHDEEQPYALVLIDATLPDMDGVEIARRLRAVQAKEAADQPLAVLMMTAADQLPESEPSKNLRLLDAVVAKPIIPGKLFDRLAGLQRGRPDPLAAAIREQHLRDVRHRAKAIRGAEILLVEDNPDNQAIIAETLTRIGLQVTVANHGREALERVAAAPYAGILMDLRMPEMDGLEAARRIRQVPRGSDLPIIAISAAGGQSDEEAARCAGMQAFLRKPIDIAELVDVLVRWMVPPPSIPAAVDDATGHQGTNHLQPGAVPAPKIPAEQAVNDPTDIATTLREIFNQLEHSDYIASETLDRLQQQAAAPKLRAMIARLRSQIASFDYAAAKDTLGEACDFLGMHPDD